MSALHSAAERTGSESDPGPPSGDRPTDRSTASRRAVLGAVGATVVTALAGCTAGADSPSRSRSDTATLVDTTVEVPPSEAASFRFDLDSERRVSVAAHLSDREAEVKRDGPAVDVVVTTPARFERFRSGGELTYVGGVSMPQVVSGEVAAALAPGEYVLVVDNSAAGGADPGEATHSAIVDLTVTAGGSDPDTVGVRPSR